MIVWTPDFIIVAGFLILLFGSGFLWTIHEIIQGTLKAHHRRKIELEKVRAKAAIDLEREKRETDLAINEAYERMKKKEIEE